MVNLYRNQAEQTPELEDRYSPKLLEKPENASPWRRPRSPQVDTAVT